MNDKNIKTLLIGLAQKLEQVADETVDPETQEELHNISEALIDEAFRIQEDTQ
ncbi:hypothetical protein GCM10007190_04770 [Macrococcus hajekii]|uniref:hypothetical protein n=1 Tax=Macrococcus hajekii TaxID=198482 RepID=UPI00140A3782|nr:hypothetical protein [Macrococcus hajekii]GGA99755.1 hypothetical protein GCM10007190_04770 [Macrococcus hajekii]